MHASEILTVSEVQTIVADLAKKAKYSPNARFNRVIFRLACGCGLRRKEIVGLNCGDLMLGGPKPVLRVRKDITKGREGKRRGRLVPLWWDKGTHDDLQRWLEHRKKQGARPSDPLLCYRTGARLPPRAAYRHWRTAIKVLGPARVAQVSIHSGRHSFCSIALDRGRSLVAVRDAAGHANIATTSIYLHAIDQQGVPDLFS